MFETMEKETMYSCGIKTLLKKIDLLSAPSTIVSFMVEFGFLLDQITVDITCKNDTPNKFQTKQKA